MELNDIQTGFRHSANQMLDLPPSSTLPRSDCLKMYSQKKRCIRLQNCNLDQYITTHYNQNVYVGTNNITTNVLAYSFVQNRLQTTKKGGAFFNFGNAFIVKQWLYVKKYYQIILDTATRPVQTFRKRISISGKIFRRKIIADIEGYFGLYTAGNDFPIMLPLKGPTKISFV